jgi:hypothetical protein
MSTLSPELALVDPELRARALAELPRMDAYAFLELPPLLLDEPAKAGLRVRPTAALAYLLVAIARTAVFDAVVFASVFACVLFVSLLS